MSQILAYSHSQAKAAARAAKKKSKAASTVIAQPNTKSEETKFHEGFKQAREDVETGRVYTLDKKKYGKDIKRILRSI
jgi:hypothetical protein